MSYVPMINATKPILTNLEDRVCNMIRLFGKISISLILSFLLFSTIYPEDLIKIGMVGLDTSHVIAFAEIFNKPENPKYIPGFRIIVGYPGGSPDVEASYTRVEKFTERLREEFGVEIVNSIEEVCQRVDAILLTSVDGRVHLEQVKVIFKAKKPVFIDKPLAGSLKDALMIEMLGNKYGVPWFSSSAYRFYTTLKRLKDVDIGTIHTVISYGPCHIEPHHPDLFWYGIHPTEALFAVMGVGCETVTRTHTPDTDVVTGVWKDGKVGVLVGLRKGELPHQVIAFGEKGTAKQDSGGDDYVELAKEIANFFKTRVPPVSPQETIEIFAFMESAEESKKLGGVPVKITEVLERAKSEISPNNDNL
ncbi:MAG: Gfo/Idh/MocA family oxidoreductase [Candidatus Hydrogenedentes bacterium]|nr:Gfo/Idh/MocA family oxidoreductase [Candidatus Hydrogenedentota bacterium]